MSFAYLPLYTGDYLRDTRHLTPMRHGIYLLALMYCWDTQGPMPLDEQESSGICNCRSADEVDGLRYVLQRFFILMDDGWYNKRMTDEVAKAERTSAARSEGGLRSAMARRGKAHRGTREKALNLSSTQAEHDLNLSSTQAELQSVSPSPSPSPSLTQTPEESPPPPTGAKTARRAARPTADDVIPPGVDPVAWQDFAAHRREIRKPLTSLSARKSADILRALSPDRQREAVNASISNRWTGVFAPKTNGKASPGTVSADAFRDMIAKGQI